MSDEQAPPENNPFAPNSPRKIRKAGAAGDEAAIKLLRRAIRKLRKDAVEPSTLEHLSELLQLPAQEVKQTIEHYLSDLTSEGEGEEEDSLTQSLRAILRESAGHSVNKIPSNWRADWLPLGQALPCKVLRAEPDGYSVIILSINRLGFLPTDQKLKIGEEILAAYVCVHNNRILLSYRTPQSASPVLEERQKSPEELAEEKFLSRVSQKISASVSALRSMSINVNGAYSFKLLKNGNISDLRIKSSSGKLTTDNVILDAIQKSVPFEEFPEGQPDSLDIIFTFNCSAFGSS